MPEGETINSILFDRPQSAELTFESIFLGAIASATLLTLPDGDVGAVLAAAAVFLYYILWDRWTGIHGRFASETDNSSLSFYLLEGISVVCGFHLIHYLVGKSSHYIPWTFNDPMATSLAAIGVAFLGIIVLELKQRSYRLWWGAVFYVVARAYRNPVMEAEGELEGLRDYSLYTLFAVAGYITLKGDAIPDEESPELEELREFVALGREQISNQGTLTLRTMLVFAFLSVPFLGVVALMLSYFFGTLMEIFVLVFSVLAIKHITNVLFLINGSLEFETFRSVNKTWPIQLLVYTAAIQLLFL